jgi:hypothetical protein
MFESWLIYLSAVSLVLVARHASAFVTPRMLHSAHPIADEAVFVTFTSGYCDVFVVPEVTRNGNAVYFLISSAMALDDEACIYYVIDRKYLLGTFSAGEYTVQVDRTYYGDSGLEQHPMGTLPMTVAAVPIDASIPALSQSGLLGLIVGLAVLAGFERAHRRG